jgi:peptidoglycan/LPS O-acetylase OafA/YrhL
LKRELSLYLDVVRFLAAMVVVACHIGERRIGGGILWQFGTLGSVAVIVFFVLSGYVVDYATQTRQRDCKNYALARVTRIGSVVIPALALTVLLDSMGREANSMLYEHYYLSWGILARCLTFFNEAWVDVVPGSNAPYWSLGYEIPFYVLYGIILFSSGFWRGAGIVIASLLFGPRIMSLFPMWLLGVVAYRVTEKRVVGSRLGWFLLLSSTFVAFMIFTFTNGTGTLQPEAMTKHSPQQIMEDYIIAALFAANIIGFSAISSHFAWVCRCEKLIKWSAGATFSLYLFHHPILIFVDAIASSPHDTWTYRVILVVSSVGGSFLLAELSERRKSFWRRAFVLAGSIRIRVHPGL